MSTPSTAGLLDVIESNARGGHRPLLFAGARILTADPLLGDFERADLLLGGERIVGIGPGLLTAAEDDDAIVVDCTGLVVVPAVVDTAALAGLRPHRSGRSGALAPGNAATFAVLEAGDAGQDEVSLLRRLVDRSSPALAAVVDGAVVQWDGKPTRAVDLSSGARQQAPVDASRTGEWVDRSGFLHQFLSADGRYDETRGGRAHAFQGSFWIDGDRIDYLDDLGFWAFGEFVGDELHHAGYVMRRR
ncbi:Atu4866 domain-containing protein [Kineococcus sp. SYSU DK006]|uniref:Atu4866 domain-containing protein n=1 Tax=Kineococcus sp. SYSU DK006 TaxID=3383127 RepID=UPI003D7D1770